MQDQYRVWRYEEGISIQHQFKAITHTWWNKICLYHTCWFWPEKRTGRHTIYNTKEGIIREPEQVWWSPASNASQWCFCNEPRWLLVVIDFYLFIFLGNIIDKQFCVLRLMLPFHGLFVFVMFVYRAQMTRFLLHMIDSPISFPDYDMAYTGHHQPLFPQILSQSDQNKLLCWFDSRRHPDCGRMVRDSAMVTMESL